MFDIETPLNQKSELEAQNELLKQALSSIVNYNQALGRPVMHYQFKQYALKVANDALAAVKA